MTIIKRDDGPGPTKSPLRNQIKGAPLLVPIRLEESFIAYIKQVTAHPEVTPKMGYAECMWCACQDRIRKDLLKMVSNADM